MSVLSAVAPRPAGGRLVEDFENRMVVRHPTPRTVGEGDAALYLALTGDRRPLHWAATFAQALGYKRETLHDWLVFHVVFGKSVPDVSENAIANLGYAGGRFMGPVYPGDTLNAESEVLGKKETSKGDAGIVWVRTRGINERHETVLEYCRWVLVKKRTPGQSSGVAQMPKLPDAVSAHELIVPDSLDVSAWHRIAWATGGARFWDDYHVGERLRHAGGMTIEDAEHAMATRLYQNTARVHFDAHEMKHSRFGKRLVYGGHIISLASALSYDGLENVLGVGAINAGAHVNPTFAGDTIYAMTDVVDKAWLPKHEHLGALRVLLRAVKNVDPSREPFSPRATDAAGRESTDPNLVLELDLWLLMPKR